MEVSALWLRRRGHVEVNPGDHGFSCLFVLQHELELVSLERHKNRQPLSAAPEDFRKAFSVVFVLRLEDGNPRGFGVHIPLDSLRPLLHGDNRYAMTPGLSPIHPDQFLEIRGEFFDGCDLVKGHDVIGPFVLTPQPRQ